MKIFSGKNPEQGENSREKFGASHWAMVLASFVLIGVIAILSKDFFKGDNPAEKSHEACKTLGGTYSSQSFTTEKKEKTSTFGLCKDKKNNSISMVTGYAYQGQDAWVTSCGGKVVAQDRKDKKGNVVNRSLICVSGGKVTKATNQVL